LLVPGLLVYARFSYTNVYIWTNVVNSTSTLSAFNQIEILKIMLVHYCCWFILWAKRCSNFVEVWALFFWICFLWVTRVWYIEVFNNKSITNFLFYNTTIFGFQLNIMCLVSMGMATVQLILSLLYCTLDNWTLMPAWFSFVNANSSPFGCLGKCCRNNFLYTTFILILKTWI
jgi:hypothetical protein